METVLTNMTSLFRSNWRATAIVVLATALSACGKDAAQQASPQKKESAPSMVVAKEKQAEKKEGHEAGKLVLSAEAQQAAGITTAPLEERAVQEQIAVTATIGPNQDRYAHIAPRVAGKVIRVMANLGDQVKPGQSLALIDSIEVGEAQSAYAQALSEHALAKSAMDRAEKLFADQIIPQKDYLRAKADYEKAKAVLRAAQDKRQALGVGDHASSGGSPSIFPLVAPFSGTVIEKAAVLGELAQPDRSLFSVADVSTVWIDANLYEKDLSKVNVGSLATITLAAYPGETFQGKVTYISNVIDKDSRTIKARVEIPNRDGRLKLGMFATASIATGGSAKAPLLPEDAIVLIQGQPTAFVQEGEGFEARPVELGDKLHGQVVIRSGIKPGETVVTHGAYALKAKMLKSQIGDAD